jgi:hypothetical protein
MRYLILLGALVVSGCQTYTPVELETVPVPKECKLTPYNDLPEVPKLEGDKVTPDALNKHWAKHYRLKARPRYRNLREAYRVCSTYAAKK